jgi:hypothetical protein
MQTMSERRETMSKQQQECIIKQHQIRYDQYDRNCQTTNKALEGAGMSSKGCYQQFKFFHDLFHKEQPH